jgi:hypothetical protein
MKWWQISCLRPQSARGGANNKEDLRQCKAEMKRCKKVHRLLERDLRQIRTLHAKNAHLPNPGGQGQALEIDLLSRIRAAEIKIVECKSLIVTMKQKKRESAKGDPPSSMVLRMTPRGNGDEDDLMVKRAMVLQELQTLFGGMKSLPTMSPRRIKAFSYYREPFKYL